MHIPHDKGSSKKSKKPFGKLIKGNFLSQKYLKKKGKQAIQLEQKKNENEGKKHPITYDKVLTVNKCGPWLAIILFGLNVVVFGLGWMLLALQYKFI